MCITHFTEGLRYQAVDTTVWVPFAPLNVLNFSENSLRNGLGGSLTVTVS